MFIPPPSSARGALGEGRGGAGPGRVGQGFEEANGKVALISGVHGLHHQPQP